ncbi:MAG: hypothetical protein JWP29_3806 [Rhodoferax sp.]|nr:hypothetical protein [Rhodoferax sp.]
MSSANFYCAFDYFQDIICIRPEPAHLQLPETDGRFKKLGIAERVKTVPPVYTPGHAAAGQVMTHRNIIAQAQAQGLESVLVFEQTALFLDDALQVLLPAIGELCTLPWQVCYLGGQLWRGALEAQPGCRHWHRAQDFSGVHAIAYHRRVYDHLLQQIPDVFDRLDSWLHEHRQFEQFLRTVADAVVIEPRIASLPALLPFEAPEVQFSYTL